MLSIIVDTAEHAKSWADVADSAIGAAVVLGFLFMMFRKWD